jgi:hypothetical protein
LIEPWILKRRTFVMTITCSESETAVQPASDPDPAPGYLAGNGQGSAENGEDQAAAVLALEGGAEVDIREALYNDCRIGPASLIQLPLERITSLSGFAIDLDPGLIRPDNGLFQPSDDPRTFLERIEPVLSRHPLLRHAQVRATGSGLHLLVLLGPAIRLNTSGEQSYWNALAKIVQRSIPADPRAPSITALTRPPGSTNAKTGKRVEILKQGNPVSQEEVVRFAKAMSDGPFLTIVQILLGTDRVEICPICQQQALTVYAKEGRCYECGRVRFDALLDMVFLPRGEVGMEESGPAAKGSRGKKPQNRAKKT